MPPNGMSEMFSVNYNNKAESQFNEYVSYVVVAKWLRCEGFYLQFPWT